MFMRPIVALTLSLALGMMGAAWAGGGWPPPAESSEKGTPGLTAQRADQAPTPSHQTQGPGQPASQVTAQGPESASKPFYRDITKPGKFELGVIGGEPLGLSAKLWLSRTRAIDAGLGWSLIGEDTNMQLHADYLFHSFDVVKVDKGSLPLYYGLGGRVRFGEDTRFGVRVPMGVQYISSSKTFSLFLEVAPIISFVPDAEVDLNVGLGARFFFFQ